MSRVWYVARHHFTQEVKKRSFLIVLFSLPLFMGLSLGLGFLFESLQNSATVVGYVDEANFVTQPLETDEDRVVLQSYADRASAQQALATDRVDAYYVIPADYAETGQVELIAFESPNWRGISAFEDLMRLNLVASRDPDLVARALYGATVTIRAADSDREFPARGPSAGSFLPVAGALIFSFMVLTTSGYMAESVAVEKENRTMEIVVSSISPRRLMAGKTLGAIAIAVLQLIVWSLFLAIGVWVGGRSLGIAWLQDVKPAWGDLAGLIVVAIPAYFFVSGLMTMIGAMMTSTNDAQQIGPLIFLVLLLPIYLMAPLSSNPNGTVALIFSFIPATSVMTIGLRSLFIQVPTWQIAVATITGTLGAALAVWGAGAALRLAMLRYGQRLRLRELLERKQGSVNMTGAASGD
jgi:ABC-2 type transport system permease protein